MTELEPPSPSWPTCIDRLPQRTHADPPEHEKDIGGTGLIKDTQRFQDASDPQAGRAGRVGTAGGTKAAGGIEGAGRAEEEACTKGAGRAEEEART